MDKKIADRKLRAMQLKLRLQQLAPQARVLIGAAGLLQEYVNVTAALSAHADLLLKELDEREGNSSAQPDGQSVSGAPQPAAGEGGSSSVGLPGAGGEG